MVLDTGPGQPGRRVGIAGEVAIKAFRHCRVNRVLLTDVKIAPIIRVDESWPGVLPALGQKELCQAERQTVILGSHPYQGDTCRRRQGN